MKYIKKFETLNNASGYIIPNPFIGHVEDGQLIANTEDNKKLEIENGNIVIANAVTLITFTIRDMIGSHLCQAEQGMNWGQWVDDERYNTLEYYIGNYDGEDIITNGGGYLGYDDSTHSHDEYVSPQTIIEETKYCMWGDN